ncbi:TRAP transporter small permease [Chloroflexota bacterium]
MKKLFRWLKSGNKGIEAVAVFAAAAIMGLVTLQAFGQIVARFAFQAAQDWGTEILVGSVVWIVMLVLATVLREDRHIKLDVVYVHLGGRLKRVANMVAFSFITLAMGVFTVYSSMYMANLIRSEAKSESTLGTPDWAWMLALIVGGVIFTLVSLELFIESVKQLRAAREDRSNGT